ncbi:hypothetical protein GGR54DRAFT_643335 [Hypoxylon sp. NC1633]|nr:hypothetical protein GGR54DRAFT_643335 [Hypoxylon sp. NC1633]
MITMTMVMFVLLALLGFADAPDHVCSAIDAAAKDALARIEENIRPILPTSALVAIAIFCIVGWYPPRHAAAWDWVSTRRLSTKGTVSMSAGSLPASTSYVDSIMLPFRFEASPTHLARRFADAKRQLTRTLLEVLRRVTAEQNWEAQVIAAEAAEARATAAEADLVRSQVTLQLNKEREFATKLEKGWANTIRDIKLRFGRPTPIWDVQADTSLFS